MGLWSSLKQGISKFGSTIKRGIKQAAKFAYDHREGIGKAIGAGLDLASNLGVPGAGVASKVVKGLSKAVDNDFTKGIKEGGGFIDKNKKAIKENESNTSSQQSGGYSLSTRGSGGTREGKMFNSYRSFR